MDSSPHVERTLTELDHARLARVIRNADSLSHRSPIGEALDAAHIVPSNRIDSDVVTMCSQVLLADLATNGTYALTLCYPSQAKPGIGSVSVLSPLGASLIGLHIGDIAHWCAPDGADCAAQVVALLFQPEASGLHTL
jgi:regulator of nucleoside diphosphate kinase